MFLSINKLYSSNNRITFPIVEKSIQILRADLFCFCQLANIQRNIFIVFSQNSHKTTTYVSKHPIVVYVN